MNKVLKYNLDSSKKYGWSPEWFDCETFNEELIESVKYFQEDYNLKPDGMVGPTTLRRKETELLDIDDYSPIKKRRRKGEKFIIYNDEKFPIAWDRVITWKDHGGLMAKDGCYYDWSDKPARCPIQFVNHWDATLSSESCARIINKRGLSMHFLIDNDGTIYQMLDIQHVAWQAGSKLWNTAGIGVEISNAFYLKYQDWYKKKGFGERPIVVSELNNRAIGPHLDFYPIQLDALAALWAAIHDATGINLEVCNVKGVDEDCRQLKFNGFINHYNLTSNKIDCASLDMDAVLENAKVFSQNFY
jgi:hypothetical protein